MQHGFVSVRDNHFKPTHKDADVVLADALDEFDNNPAGEPGQARLELAARGAYPLISTLSLWADRGTNNNHSGTAPLSTTTMAAPRSVV